MQSKELWEIMVICQTAGCQVRVLHTLPTQDPAEVTADVFHGYVEALFKGKGQTLVCV